MHLEATFCRRVLLLAVLVLLCIAAGPREASATLKFQKVMVDRFLSDHPDPDYVTFVKRKVKCYFCHQGRKDRTNHNAFGKELAKLLDFETDEDNLEKIADALQAVAHMPSDPNDPASKTFGQLISESLLPGGELEDLKKEPDELAQLPHSETQLQ